MRPFMLFIALLVFPTIACGNLALRVVDDDGQPVERFNVMVHTFDQGYVRWMAGKDGKFDLSSLSRHYGAASTIDVLVRAEGYASVLQSFSGQAKEELLRGGAQVVLERGREVRLKLQPPDGMKFPDGFSPQIFFPELAEQVEIMWQPENLRIETPDFNMLNVWSAKEGSGEFTFRLPSQRRKFFVAIHHPGWLRYFKAGPFTSEDFTNDEMALEIPRPAGIDVRVTWGDADDAGLPFNGVRYHLMRQREPGGNSYLSVGSEQRPLTDTSFRVADLGPGHYLLQAFTEPTKLDDIVKGTEINPGRFMAMKYIDLEPGQSVSESLQYVPFDGGANRGNRTARIHVIGADGLPAAGKQLKVNWFDGHYGSLTVFDGPIPADGVVALEGISDQVPTEAPFGPYSVEVGGENLGFFRVKAEAAPQDFTFQLVPKEGDVAPDVEFVALESGERVRLKNLRGKAVFLEFWETGCGPCQPMMAKLNELIGTKGADWQDDVAVLPVSLDANPEIIASHVKSRGWNNLRHYWSSRSGTEYFTDAARAFVVHGVPMALLIDREGKIAWRGHPMAIDIGAQIDELVSEKRDL